MNRSRISKTAFAVVAVIAGLGMMAAGTFAYGQTTTTVPSGENTSSIHSRIGGTMRGQGPTDSYGQSFTVEPGAVPVGENTASAHSRIGQTMRGHGPTDSYGQSFTVQPTNPPPAESTASITSRIGGTMRGMAPIN